MLCARVLILLQVLSCTASAYAQEPSTSEGTPGLSAEPSPADLQRARTLFQRGVEHAQRQEFAAASKRFREALAVHYAPAVEYNLASALYETGQYLEAYNRAQSVIRHADATDNLRTLAERLERTLRAYVARLTLVTGGEAREIAVSLDGHEVQQDALGVPQAVTPGSHEIAATREGVEVSRREVNIPVRTAAIVDLSVIVTAQEAAAMSVVQGEPEPAPLAPALPPDEVRSDRGWKGDWRVWTVVAAGVVAVGAGVGLALVLTNDDTKSAEPPVSGDSEPGVLKW